MTDESMRVEEAAQAHRARPDGAADPDADGASTASEFLAGTDPRNAASVLRVSIAMATNATVTVRFPVVADRTYSVLHSDAPTGSPWLKLV